MASVTFMNSWKKASGHRLWHTFWENEFGIKHFWLAAMLNIISQELGYDNDVTLCVNREGFQVTLTAGLEINGKNVAVWETFKVTPDADQLAHNFEQESRRILSLFESVAEDFRSRCIMEALGQYCSGWGQCESVNCKTAA